MINFLFSILFTLIHTGYSHLKLSPKVSQYCSTMDVYFKKHGWPQSQCHSMPWNHVRNSVLGTPLVWHTFGDENAKNNDITMVICGVHGDEITPVKFCFDIIHFLRENQKQFEKKLIIVAPLANPDSFFTKRPTRTNHRKVDINRNFPTSDWKKKALQLWANRYKKAPRRYPGPSAMSEPETLFQVNLILRYKPHKIISVHAPLTMLDYDGPTFTPAEKDTKKAMTGIQGKQLLHEMGEKAANLRIKSYGTFPGSLGRWAGNQKHIPTYTLELPSSDARHSQKYWLYYKDAIIHAFNHDLSKL